MASPTATVPRQVGEWLLPPPQFPGKWRVHVSAISVKFSHDPADYIPLRGDVSRGGQDNSKCSPILHAVRQRFRPDPRLAEALGHSNPERSDGKGRTVSLQNPTGSSLVSRSETSSGRSPSAWRT